MLAGKNKVLQEILDLRFEGKLSEATKKLSKFISKDYPAEEKIRGQIIHAQFTSYSGQWEKGLEIIKKAIQESKSLEDPLLEIDIQIAYITCLSAAQQHNVYLKIIEKVNEKLENKKIQNDYDYKIRKAWVLIYKGGCLNWLGDYEEASIYIEKSLKYIEEVNDLELLFLYHQNKGLNVWRQDIFEEARVHYERGYQLADKKENLQWKTRFSVRLAEVTSRMGRLHESIKYIDLGIEYTKEYGVSGIWFHYLKAWNLWSLGELNEAIQLFKEIMPEIEQETTPKEISLTLTAKALIDWVEGNLNSAIEQQEEAVNQIKKTDDIFSINIITIHLIRLLFDKGEFSKALDYCFTIIETYKEPKREIRIPTVYLEMGKIYHILGDYNLALDYTKRALKLWKKYESELFIAQTFFSILQICLDKNDSKQYESFLEEFEDYVTKHPSKLLDQMYKTAYALVLKASSKPRNWSKATEILIDIIKNKTLKHGHVIIAHINLCELLMNEFSISGDEEVLKELEFYVDELIEVAKKENIHHLRLEANNIQILTHWLKAQKSMIDIDLQKAKNLLNETRRIADEKGLYRLAEKLSLQMETQLKHLSEWDDFIRKYYEFIKE